MSVATEGMATPHVTESDVIVPLAIDGLVVRFLRLQRTGMHGIIQCLEHG
jgi:hypothetical protein